MNPGQPRSPAEIYEQYYVPAMFLPWATLLLRHVIPQRNEKVLDLACGTGIVARLAAPLLGTDGMIVGLDINAAMLAVARALPVPSGAAIDWKEGSALDLPFPDEAFDVVLCQHGLPFFPDRAKAMSEMRRVLVPGGRVAVIVLQVLERHAVFEALMGSVARHLALPLANVMTPFSLPDADKLHALFTGAGFENVDISTISTTVQFPDPERFVPLAVASSAAAVPAFAQLDPAARAVLVEKVREDVEPVLLSYRDADHISFPMFAHLAMATR